MYWSMRDPGKEGTIGGGDESAQDQVGETWEEVSFIHSIPGDDIDEGVAILLDGSMRSYIQCMGLNALLFDDADRETLAKNFAKFANSCNSDIQIIVKSRNLPVDEYLSRYQILIKTENDYLKWYADYTDKWFRRVQDVTFVPQRDFYVVISYQPPDCATSSEPWKDQRSMANNEQYLQTLNRMTETAVKQLRASNLRPHILRRKELRNLIYADLNPNLAQRDPQAPPSGSGLSEASSLAGSALKIADEHLWLDGRYIGTQYLQSMPDKSWMGWLVDLLTLNHEYSLSLFIHTCEPAKVRNTLKKKYRTGVIKSTRSGGLNQQELETIEAASSSIKQFLSTADREFDISMYITTSAESPERLAKNINEIRSVFKKKDAILNRGQLLQLNAWQSTLASGVDRLAIVHRVTSSTVGNFWPFFSASCGTPDGVPFGFAIASREPVLLNPFFRGAGKDTNNMLIVGGPGAGTSFAVFMLILRLLPLGTRFVLINGMNKRFASETFITRILGPELSETIDLGLASAHTLNPFDLDFGDNSGEPSADKMANLLSLFDLMLAPEGQEELDVEEKSLLGGLIRLAYRNANLTGSVPCLSDLAQLTVQAAVNETDPVQRERLGILCRGLLLYTREGPFAGLVDGHTNIDAEKLLIVFDTSALNEPRLQRIAQFMLVEYIERLAVDYKARNVRFAAIIDEISVVMQFRSGARLLADLCARSRKYGMMLVSVTRQWKDFSSHSEQAAAVIKYSNTKLILRQDANDLKDLKEALSLTDAEAVSVEQFAAEEQEKRHCQCLLIVGSVHGTIRLVPSPMDYWICTCEPSKDEPRRAEMIREIKVKNPKLTETDACRQAVYYLGIQHES